MKWECRKKIGETCPLESKISIADDIMLIDCMEADCPHLKIEGMVRIDTRYCTDKMPNDPTHGTLTNPHIL